MKTIIRKFLQNRDINHKSCEMNNSQISKKNTNVCECPLCKTKAGDSFYVKAEKEYLKCNNCDLVFLSPNTYLSKNEEKARYDLHQNNSPNSGYVKFLENFFYPMQNFVKEGSYGLDFGSGPNPILSKMFEKAGHKMKTFDMFYENNTNVFRSEEYDFITLTEVIEHLHNPIEILNKLWLCLKQKGHLGIMTKFLIGVEDFPKWYYKNDPTHVCFFSKNTFKWIAEKLNAKIDYIKDDVVILAKI